ncbi:MAG TPA: ATP-binding protein, partial [bacterium]|nr:ATP-binding protein [bacterium]
RTVHGNDSVSAPIQADSIDDVLRARISQLEKANEALRFSFGRLASLQEMARAISATHDLYEILEKVIGLVCDFLQARESVWLWFDSETLEYIPDQRLHGTNVLAPAVQAYIEEGILDWALQQRRPAIISLSQTDPGGTDVLVPFVTSVGMSAVLHLETTLEESCYEGQHFEILSLIQSHAATALENARLWGEMENFKDYTHNTIESLQQGVIVLNERNEVTLANRVSLEIFGLLDSQVIGLNWVQIVPPEFLGTIDDLLTQALIQGRSEEEEITLDRPDGSKSVAVTASLLKNARGDGLGLILVLRDLTESKEILELQKLDQLKTEFLSNVSHELRTPITSIKAYTETLLDQVESEDVETQKEFLRVVIQETERLSRLIEDLLDLSRIERGKVEFHFERGDLQDVLQRAVAMLQPSAPLHQLQIVADASLEPFEFDRDKIHQVINNLLGNAIKYSPRGGLIQVAVSPEGSQVHLSVQDSGIGITDEDLPKLFGRFFRAESPLKYEVPGTGLGLVISQFIVHAHRGRIWVESEYGRGTTVHVVLPKKPAEAALQQ